MSLAYSYTEYWVVPSILHHNTHGKKTAVLGSTVVYNSNDGHLL